MTPAPNAGHASGTPGSGPHWAWEVNGMVVVLELFSRRAVTARG
jgi:hypothetical protein